MKRKTLSVLLIIIMIACFAGAISYPLMYNKQKDSNEQDMTELREMRRSALDNSADPEHSEVASDDDYQPQTEATAYPTDAASEPGAEIGETSETNPESDISVDDGGDPESLSDSEEEEGKDRRVRVNSALAYPEKEKVVLDEALILPQYREIYEQNNDLVGWLYIPNTGIDYPVLQNADNDYYLRRDFYGNKNSNGQLILYAQCDGWTPSYNLVISGHNMKSGKMFADIPYYASKGFWKNHKTFTYDSIIREGTYVVFAAFYSADYDEHEEGFRYNADIQYSLDARKWLEEIMENRIYDTGIDVEFGDEFLTLTTCTYQRENGRFVVVARRVREGEVIE